MSDSSSRRDLLRNVALSSTLGGLSADAASQVHQLAAAEKKAVGKYTPKAFTDAEWRAVSRLCDLIFPGDGASQGALAGGTPEYIDLLASANPKIAASWTGGIAWMNAHMQAMHGADFVDAKPERQTGLLDIIAYRRNANAQYAPGVAFFDLARRMAADGYYTSKAGIADVGYLGNKGMSKFDVPAEAVTWAFNHSPFKA